MAPALALTHHAPRRDPCLPPAFKRPRRNPAPAPHAPPSPPAPHPPPAPLSPPQTLLSLPQDALLRILHHLPSATALATLSATSPALARALAQNPSLWRRASFKGTTFAPRVTPHLTLGPRPGLRVLATAASQGNEWAAFLHAYFAGAPLRGLTLSPFLARALFSARPAPGAAPASASAAASAAAAALPEAGWLVVHAARARGVPGAVVGLVFLSRHTVVRAIALDRPILCAGFRGVWRVGVVLGDWIIRALHAQ